MRRNAENNKKKFIRKTAIALFGAGFSIDFIQKEVGEVSAADIQKWREIAENRRKKHYKNKVTFGTIVKKEDNILCEGSRRCKNRNNTARFKTFQGKHLCNKCYMRHRREKLKELGKEPKLLQQKPTEYDRRKKIFAKWNNPELDAFRRTPEYQQWRIAVLERDNYTCAHCEQIGGKLHVHHIKTAKLNKEIRLDINNGIVLCNKCHSNLHINRYDNYIKVVKLNA